ncbi:AAA-like domain protein [Streptococcus parauberis]|uniref:AAA-like domain protein n=1 Tax=Streptococcus parauberis TaxID=1348 RepID=A0A854WBK4_9STRE|nr:ATP-binding protein [Streptococcus parauberis]PCH10647.1 AAA-like domain protein [Streptococcus parauberis]
MVKKLEYPIDRIHENLALRKDKVVVAYYRIPNTPITITDSDKKDSHKEKVSQVLKKLAKYKNFDVSLIPKDFLLGEKMADFADDMADDLRILGNETLEFTVDTLTREMEIPYQFDWVIGVNLGKGLLTGNVKDYITEQIDSIASNIASLAGYAVEIDDDWYKQYQEEEILVYSLLSTLKAKKIVDDDLFYYQRMQYLRYIPHARNEVTANRAMLNITDTLIKPMEGGFLKLESPYGSSFVSILPVGRFSTIFNGFHLGELVQRMSFPVELRFKAEFVDKNKLGGTMGRSNTRYDQIMKEAYSTNTVQQDDILMGAYSLKDLMKKVGNKEEIIEYGCFLVVAGSSLKQLNQRRHALLSYFADMKVAVYEASHDTPYLFQALLYGQDLQKTTRKWNHLVTSRGFSELMLFTNTQSGNKVGWYIGRVDNRLTAWDSIGEAIMGSKNLVLFNATVANKEDVAGKVTKNPHMIITGATGEGKSYLAQMIFLQTAQQNVRVLYVDPKRELRSHYLKVVSDPEYARKFPARKKQIESINFVTLDYSLKENHGVLDPIVILDREDASATAKNILLYLGQSVSSDRTPIVPTALNDVIGDIISRRENGEVVGFNQVIEALIESDRQDIVDMGKYYRSIIRGSILELAFSDGDISGLSYEERVTVLEVADLSLPKDDTKHISDHEKNSIALMFALGAFCKHFGERTTDETVEIFDEAWVLMQSSEGKAVIKSMRRVGRSKYNVLMLVSQSVHDAENDDDKTGFGTIFSFYEKSEREDILKHVGLEITPKNLEWIDNMISGQCLYYDVYGNLNMISVHNIHPDLDPLLKPMKESVSSQLENKYAS